MPVSRKYSRNSFKKSTQKKSRYSKNKNVSNNSRKARLVGGRRVKGKRVKGKANKSRKTMKQRGGAPKKKRTGTVKVEEVEVLVEVLVGTGDLLTPEAEVEEDALEAAEVAAQQKLNDEKEEKKESKISEYLLEYYKEKLIYMIYAIKGKRKDVKVIQTISEELNNDLGLNIYLNLPSNKDVRDEISILDITTIYTIIKHIDILGDIITKECITNKHTKKITRLDTIFNMLCDDVLYNVQDKDCFNELFKLSNFKTTLTFIELGNIKKKAVLMLKEFVKIKAPDAQEQEKRKGRKEKKGKKGKQSNYIIQMVDEAQGDPSKMNLDIARMLKEFNIVCDEYLNTYLTEDRKNKLLSTILKVAIITRPSSSSGYEDKNLQWLNDVFDLLIDVENIHEEVLTKTLATEAPSAEAPSAEEAAAEEAAAAIAVAKIRSDLYITVEIKNPSVATTNNQSSEENKLTVSALRQPSEGKQFEALTLESRDSGEIGSDAAHGLYEFQDGTYLGQYIIQHYCKGEVNITFNLQTGLLRKDWGNIFTHIINKSPREIILQQRYNKKKIIQIVKDITGENPKVIDNNSLRIVLYSLYIVIRICKYIIRVRKNDMHLHKLKRGGLPPNPKEVEIIKRHQNELAKYTELCYLLQLKTSELEPFSDIEVKNDLYVESLEKAAAAAAQVTADPGAAEAAAAVKAVAAAVKAVAAAVKAVTAAAVKAVKAVTAAAAKKAEAAAAAAVVTEKAAAKKAAAVTEKAAAEAVVKAKTAIDKYYTEFTMFKEKAVDEAIAVAKNAYINSSLNSSQAATATAAEAEAAATAAQAAATQAAIEETKVVANKNAELAAVIANKGFEKLGRATETNAKEKINEYITKHFV